MPIQRFRKKPVVIEAIRFTGEPRNLMDIHEFCGDENIIMDDESTRLNVHIKTLEGNLHVSHGDYIIKGVKGEFYPCKPDIFEATYELVAE